MDREFSLPHHNQTISGTSPGPYPEGSGISFLRDKASRA